MTFELTLEVRACLFQEFCSVSFVIFLLVFSRTRWFAMGAGQQAMLSP